MSQWTNMKRKFYFLFNSGMCVSVCTYHDGCGMNFYSVEPTQKKKRISLLAYYRHNS